MSRALTAGLKNLWRYWSHTIVHVDAWCSVELSMTLVPPLGMLTRSFHNGGAQGATGTTAYRILGRHSRRRPFRSHDREVMGVCISGMYCCVQACSTWLVHGIGVLIVQMQLTHLTCLRCALPSAGGSVKLFDAAEWSPTGCAIDCATY